MALGLFLIPALGGYLLLTRLDSTRDRITRGEGYHVVFQAAVAGMALFGLARLIVTYLNWHYPDIGEGWKKLLPIDYSGTATLSVLLGLALPIPVNCFVDRLQARRRTASETGDHIGLVVDEAIQAAEEAIKDGELQLRRLVEVTLSSRKSYIGFPLARTFLVRDNGGDLVLVPFFSGYRDKETLELRVDVNYATVLHERREEGTLDLADFRIALPMREIFSARPFNPRSYEQFQARRPRADSS